MMRTPNLIHGLTLDVAYEGGVETSESLAEWLREALLPVVDAALAERDQAGLVRRIERLEVDLGTVSRENAEDELARRLAEQLASALGDVLESPGEVTAGAAHAQEGEQLLNFLRSGSLPWSVAADQQTAHEQLLRRVLSSSRAAEVLREVVQERQMLVRLVRQFSAAALSDVAAVLHPRLNAAVRQDADEAEWLAVLQGTRAPAAVAAATATDAATVPAGAVAASIVAGNGAANADAAGPEAALAQFRAWRQRNAELPMQLEELHQWLLWWLMHDSSMVNQDCSLMLESIAGQCAQARDPVQFMRLVLGTLRSGGQLDLEALAQQTTAPVVMDAIASLTSQQSIRNFVEQQVAEDQRLGNLNSAQLHQLVRAWIGDSSSVFLASIESHALRAESAHNYFKQILQALLESQPIDLETLCRPAPAAAPASQAAPASAAGTVAAPEQTVLPPARALSTPIAASAPAAAQTAPSLPGASSKPSAPAQSAASFTQAAPAQSAASSTQPAPIQSAASSMQPEPAQPATSSTQPAPAQLAVSSAQLSSARSVATTTPSVGARPALPSAPVGEPASSVADAPGGSTVSIAALGQLASTTSAGEPSTGGSSALAGKSLSIPPLGEAPASATAGSLVSPTDAAVAGPVASTNLAGSGAVTEPTKPGAISEAAPPAASAAGDGRGTAILPAESRAQEAAEVTTSRDVATSDTASRSPSPLPALLQQSLPQRLANAMLQADLGSLETIWSEITRYHADVLIAAAQRYLRRPQERANLVARSSPTMLVPMLKAMSPATGQLIEPILQHAERCGSVLSQPLSQDVFRQRVLNFAFHQVMAEEDVSFTSLIQAVLPAQCSPEDIREAGYAWRAILPSIHALDRMLFGDRYLLAVEQRLQEEDDSSPALHAMLVAELFKGYPELIDQQLREQLMAADFDGYALQLAGINEDPSASANENEGLGQNIVGQENRAADGGSANFAATAAHAREETVDANGAHAASTVARDVVASAANNRKKRAEAAASDVMADADAVGKDASDAVTSGTAWAGKQAGEAIANVSADDERLDVLKPGASSEGGGTAKYAASSPAADRDVDLAASAPGAVLHATGQAPANDATDAIKEPTSAGLGTRENQAIAEIDRRQEARSSGDGHASTGAVGDHQPEAGSGSKDKAPAAARPAIEAAINPAAGAAVDAITNPVAGVAAGPAGDPAAGSAGDAVTNPATRAAAGAASNPAARLAGDAVTNPAAGLAGDAVTNPVAGAAAGPATNPAAGVGDNAATDFIARGVASGAAINSVAQGAGGVGDADSVGGRVSGDVVADSAGVQTAGAVVSAAPAVMAVEAAAEIRVAANRTGGLAVKTALEAEGMLAILLMRAEPLGRTEQLAAELMLQRLLRVDGIPLSGALETALSHPAAIERLVELAPAPVLAQLLVLLQAELAAQLPTVLRTVAASVAVSGIPAMQSKAHWRIILQTAFITADPVTPVEFIRNLMRNLGAKADTAQPPAQPAAHNRQAAMQALLQPLANRPAEQPASAAPYEQAQDEPTPLTGESNIRNAGMVIIATYAQRLFSILELTKDGKFTSDEAAQRAVHLLQYAITGATTTPEYQLVLNKLLCGIHGGQPIARGIDITDKEKDTIEQMLNGVIAHWKALGKTSISGLRQTFLQREGHLYFEEDAWHLKIPTATFDMLLDRLPWSFAMIKFPWMEHALHVTWR